jgi:beta-N-acetylhexosaminidase
VQAKLNRRAFLRGSGQAVAAALLAGCATHNGQAFTPGSVSLSTNLVNLTAKKPPLLAPLQANLPIPDVPLEVKIGQMLMLGFRGQYLTDDSTIVRVIREQHLGSVVLFRYNVGSPSQLREMTAMLQAASSQPLLIAIDHEGGLVNRFVGDFGFVSNYSAQELGEHNDLALTRTQSANAAQRLAAFGINLNLAPVVDLNLNPSNPVIGGVHRSFSSDPTIVNAHARAMIESHHEHNVLCTLKHFPGHGSSYHDSHRGFVDVTDTWQVSELSPYAALIGNGVCDAVMTAHIFNAMLDAERPATLSHAIVTGLLRERLGYDGVVISDDMQMRAISTLYDFETAVRLVIEAGVDIIAIGNNLSYAEDWAERTVGIIRGLVESGVLSAERIDQSYRRIMRLKGRLKPLGATM